MNVFLSVFFTSVREQQCFQRRYEYSPQNRLSTFLFRVQLESTVNITRKNPLTLEMPGFRNVLGHDNIHITGKDGYKFELPTGFVYAGALIQLKWDIFFLRN